MSTKVVISENIVKMMEIIDDNKENISEGDYIKFCWSIRQEYTSTDTKALKEELKEYKDLVTWNEERIEQLEHSNTSWSHSYSWARKVSASRSAFLKKAYLSNKKTGCFTKTEMKFLDTMFSQDNNVEISGRGHERERNIVTQIEAPMYDESTEYSISSINTLPLMVRRLM
jgi:hypothetical protein